MFSLKPEQQQADQNVLKLQWSIHQVKTKSSLTKSKSNITAAAAQKD